MNWSPNLTSISVKPGVPWEFTDTSRIPANVRTDKKARTAWINNPTTQHHVYSLCEGVISTQRIRKARSDDEGNPVAKIYGLVVDYDAPTTDEELLSHLSRLPYKPAWRERTLSGNLRVIFPFSDGHISVPNQNVSEAFYELALSKVPFHLLSVGLDEGAFKDAARRYTNSGDWKKISDETIPTSVAQGWLMEVLRTIDSSEYSTGPEVPLDQVAPRLAELYPRFAEWPGEFTEGSQGPSFWVEGSVSPSSAIVKAEGMLTFADHATKSFYSWSELLGASWVDSVVSSQRGKSVENIWYDSRLYWNLLPSGRIVADSATAISLKLRLERGVSQKRRRGQEFSPLDEALNYIHTNQRIVGAGPFLFRRDRLIHTSKGSYLNTATISVMAPHPHPVTWCPETFPLLHPWLTDSYTPEQLEALFSHLSHFYRGAYLGKPGPGQSMFIAGPPGVGKTFLVRQVIGKLMGGFIDASRYLLGNEQFNSEMFEVAVHAVDDSTFLGSDNMHRKFSEMLKAMTANREHKFHEKFKTPSMIEWSGRIFCTLNVDVESMRAMPELGLSNRDKVTLLRTTDTPAFNFPTVEKTQEMLAEELPKFARFLLDYEIPVERRENRFGVQAFQEESLLEQANQSTLAAAFNEILQDFLSIFFGENPDQECWEGTSTQLHKAILADSSMESAMRPFSVNSVGRALSSLSGQGRAIYGEMRDGMRVWKICRPKHMVKEAPQHPEIPPQGEKFQK